MHIDAICETNGKGWLLWAAQCPGAFARGATENEALAKLPGDVRRFLRWAGEPVGDITVTPGAPIESSLHTEDADSDLLLEADCAPMTEADYAAAKLLVLKSTRDFCTLFESIPNPDISPRAPRTSFYGPVPRTPREMYTIRTVRRPITWPPSAFRSRTCPTSMPTACRRWPRSRSARSC